MLWSIILFWDLKIQPVCSSKEQLCLLQMKTKNTQNRCNIFLRKYTFLFCFSLKKCWNCKSDKYLNTPASRKCDEKAREHMKKVSYCELPLLSNKSFWNWQCSSTFCSSIKKTINSVLLWVGKSFCGSMPQEFKIWPQLDLALAKQQTSWQHDTFYKYFEKTIWVAEIDGAIR